MIKFQYRNYFFPLKAVRIHRLMKEAPWWSSDRLAGWSSQQKIQLVTHAAKTVPYYREKLRALNIDPRKVDDPDVWSGIPTVSKEDIRNDPSQFVSSVADSRNRFWANTSGSTGMPFSILLDANVNAAAFNLFWRAWSSGGHWKLGQRQAAMKGATSETGWRYNRAIRTLELSANHVNDATIGELQKLLLKYKPQMMRGYPSALYMFCRLLQENNLSVRIPMVVTGAETLHSYHREEIENTLGARLYNHYTHWERAASILECPNGKLHAQEDYAHHEILDDNGYPVPAGVPGEITGTGLYNRAMPLVRYRTGDVGVWSNETCDCGQVFPVVEKVLGRDSDFLVRLDGSLVPATFASSDVKFFNEVIYCQLVQDHPGIVEARIVPTETFDEAADMQVIISSLRKRLGTEMQIQTRLCGLDDLERSPVGKVRACFARASQKQLSERLTAY